MSRMEKGDRHRCSGNIKMMEYWSNGVMEKNGYRLRVTGKEVLQCCCNAVLQFKNIRLENQ